MQYGISIPQCAAFGDVRKLLELGQAAEAAGWDGFFVWDAVLFDNLWHPVVDPWIALAAIAATTERIRLGPLVTALPRRRPWKVAREALSLDQLSGGRTILGVGLGSPPEWEFAAFGEESDDRIRAEKLDEALEILLGLWSGEPFSFTGKHYRLAEMRFQPTPVQQPRIPIWVAGTWPNRTPLRRSARYDGVVPIKASGHLTPDEWRELLAFVGEERTGAEPITGVAMGVTGRMSPAEAEDKVAAFAAAGCSWWVEDISPYGYGLPWHSGAWPADAAAFLEDRIRQGPPRRSNF